MTDFSPFKQPHPETPHLTLPGALPDKRQVAASFSRAAASYDSVAELQRAVGCELLARLPGQLNPQRWLDLGCGTGYFSRILAEDFAPSEGIALDIAEGMLRHAQPLGGAHYFIAGDAERMPPPTMSGSDTARRTARITSAETGDAAPLPAKPRRPPWLTRC